MTHRHTLIAFLSTLAAIVILSMAPTHPGTAVITGLIGIAGTFKPRTPEGDGK